MNRVLLLLCLSFMVPPISASHIGSPDVFCEGAAGPYRLFVTVRTPPMIPGIAHIEARVLEGNVTDIRIAPLRIVGEGSQNAPPSDSMDKSQSKAQSFTGQLWLMESGSWQVRMEVFGAQGNAQMAVPVPAAARRTLKMDKPTGFLLAALMIFLVASMIAILGAAVRESQLESGAEASPALRRRGRIGMVVAAVMLVAILFLGNMWWDVAASSRAKLMMYKAPPIEASVQNGNTIVVKMGFSSWHDFRKQMLVNKIIPDHGHLMHLFLIRTPDFSNFYHLHPDQTSPDTFAQRMPAVAAGDYALFADIVRESGFPDTMTTQVTLPDVAGSPPSGDDSEATDSHATNVAFGHGRQVTFPDGSRWDWVFDGQTIHAQQPLLLRFRVFNKDGKPASDLEPYMGMAGHLVLVKRDLSVFAHVHPAGSAPMAALMLVGNQTSDTAQAAHAMPGMPATSIPAEIMFPYGFPQPGDYRLFVQIKRNGQVETGVFDAHAEP